MLIKRSIGVAIDADEIKNPGKCIKDKTEGCKVGDKAGQMIGEGVKFERIRRITGYLVGTVDRWNNAKRSEEHDRVKHGVSAGLEQL